MGDLDVPIDVVQLDDGYEAEIGDWLRVSDRFTSLEAVASRIRRAGRRAGIWVAPYLLGGRSSTLTEHPDWVIGGRDAPADAGWNWGQRVYGLDATHPGAQRYLREVFGTLRDLGFDFFKLDFLYAGAMPGPRHDGSDPVSAYRAGLGVIREAVVDAYLLGSGAPILPSVGLVDGMRVSPDTAPERGAPAGDPAHPSGRTFLVTGEARAFQHGRFWVNDADCLIVRPAVEDREMLAEHVERFSGLRMSSDRLADLDEWGLATTRRLLASVPPERFIPS
jgi:alpha-galactosidase